MSDENLPPIESLEDQTINNKLSNHFNNDDQTFHFQSETPIQLSQEPSNLIVENSLEDNQHSNQISLHSPQELNDQSSNSTSEDSPQQINDHESNQSSNQTFESSPEEIINEQSDETSDSSSEHIQNQSSDQSVENSPEQSAETPDHTSENIHNQPLNQNLENSSEQSDKTSDSSSEHIQNESSDQSVENSPEQSVETSDSSSEHIQNQSSDQSVENSPEQSAETPDHTSENIDKQSFNQNLQNSLEDSNVDDQINISHEEIRSNLDQQFQFDEKSDEIKPQRQLDEDEIPPADSIITQTINSSSTDDSIIDDRPLNKLEKPYEHSEEQSNDISNDDQSLIESDTTNENLIPPIKLSAFLPDIVNQTIEQDQQNGNNEITERGNSPINENPAGFTTEDFPPLPPPANIVPIQIYDQEYPPLSTNKTTSEEILTNETHQKPSTNDESISSISEDLLRNKTLLKQRIVKGKENTRPTRSTMVTISYELFLVNSLTSENRLIETISNERYFVGEGDLIPAIDISIQSMDQGEKALIDSDIRHCYGDIGCEEKSIPAISSLNSYRMKIHLELHSWINPPDIQLLSIHERITWGDKKRQMGNFYYRRQDYSNALLSYQGALRFLDTNFNPLLISSDQSEKSILNDRLIQVENNLAQVYLLLNNYQLCLDATNRVLQLDPKNVKALFRQGNALFHLNQFQQAISPLKLYTQIQRTNSITSPDIDKALEIISISEQKVANYKKNEKEMYQRMFQSTTTTTTNQQITAKNSNQIKDNNWLTYLAFGSAALAAVGIFTFMKYRKI